MGGGFITRRQSCRRRGLRTCSFLVCSTLKGVLENIYIFYKDNAVESEFEMTVIHLLSKSIHIHSGFQIDRNS